MSIYRPYYDPTTFRSPTVVGYGDVQDSGSYDYDYLDGDEAAGLGVSQSRAAAVGVTVGRFYARMVLAQPFEVTKFLLQVGEWDRAPGSYAPDAYYDDYDTSSDDEEVDYFVDTSSAIMDPRNSSQAAPNKKPSRPHQRKHARLGKISMDLIKAPPTPFPYAISLEQPSVFGLMSALADTEGPLSVWRGLHASCLYRAARELLETWLTGFFTSIALSSSADPQFVDILQSTEPALSIVVSTSACALACAALAPVAMIRARLLVTSFASKEPRSLRYWLLNLRSAVAPISVIVPSVLAAGFTHLVRMCTPLLLLKQLDIDQFRTPRLYSLASLGADLFALFVKMPLETMANRAQVRVSRPPQHGLIIPPKEYRGMISTLWAVLRGYDSPATLYRGWRCEILGTIGEWGYEALDAGRPNPEHF